MSTIVKRTTLVVRNIERSVAFYSNVLGYSPAFDREDCHVRQRLPRRQGGRPDGEPIRMRSMTILDPDGFILEVNQRPT